MNDFEIYLLRVQVLLNEMNLGYRKIWVQGYFSPGITKLCVTLFNNNGYEMRFLDIKNFSTNDSNINNYVNEIKKIIN
jgi:hypothetical protein